MTGNDAKGCGLNQTIGLLQKDTSSSCLKRSLQLPISIFFKWFHPRTSLTDSTVL